MPRRRRRRFFDVSRLRTLLSIVIVCAFWELQGHVLHNQFLPPLSAILSTQFDLFKSGTLWSPLLETFLLFVLTSALSIVIGGLLGIAMGASRILDAILGPGIDTLAAIPAVAFVPLWIIWFGPNESALVPFTLVLSVPAMAINTRSGLRSTDPALIEMARAEAATKIQTFRYVLLPASLPLLVSGIRLTIGRSLIGVIIGEELLTGVGLGGLLVTYGGAFSADQLWALIVLILIISYLIGVSSNWTSRVLLGWRQGQLQQAE
jgi:NitT/TauT family transport system permease protein